MKKHWSKPFILSSGKPRGVQPKFREVELTRKGFDKLCYMGPCPWWRKTDPEDKFLMDLCYSPIKEVAEKVIEASKVNRQHVPCPHKVFTNLPMRASTDREDGRKEEHPWFSRHAKLCSGFNRELMGHIWIRNLSEAIPAENKEECSFYLEDGNHRALVYAVLIALGKEVYQPVKALHATTWDFDILSHPTERQQNLVDDGELPEND